MSKVSVIMPTGNDRMGYLNNVLLSWSRVTHPNFDFILVDNCGDPNSHEVEQMARQFPFITKATKTDKKYYLNHVWRWEGIASDGDYVVFCAAHEILGQYNILEMMEENQKARSSAIKYCLNQEQTDKLSSINWLDNPKIIEDLPGFWDYDFSNHPGLVDWEPNSRRLSAGLLMNLSGATRKYWEFLGWHRDDEFGYLNTDTDIVLREYVLREFAGVPMPITVGSCYHQYHDRAPVPQEQVLPAYVYENEAQARLLEPARHGL